MKSLIQSDITKTLLYFILTLSVAAALSPWTYNVGKMIAEVAESRSGSNAISGLPLWLGTAKFSWFFLVTLIFAALMLSVPFIGWLGLSNHHSHPVRPWRIRLRKACLPDVGQALAKHPKRWFVWTTGFLLAGSILTLMNWLFLLVDWFSFTEPLNWVPAILISFALAVSAAIVVEWLFRGVLLGVFLRSLRPGLAIFLSACIFGSLYYFLPTHQHQHQHHFTGGGEADAGVRYISESIMQTTLAPGFLAGFVGMLIAGMILGYARYRTASLALPSGILTGWLCIIIFAAQILTEDHQLTEKIGLFIGSDKISGMIPLSFIIATGLLTHVFLEILPKPASEDLDEPT